MKESHYRRQFANLLVSEIGGWKYHPADFKGMKAKQADIFFCYQKPVLFEMKRWLKKKSAWTFAAEFNRNPKQVKFYEKMVKMGFLVFYVVYYPHLRHPNNMPDVLYCVNDERAMTFGEMADKTHNYFCPTEARC